MTEMRFVRNETVPGTIVIRGTEYKILYNFEAMAAMEAAMKLPIDEIMRRFWQGGTILDAKTRETIPVLTVREQMTMLQCMMAAAGCEAKMDDLLACLDGRDAIDIASAIGTEILMKTPRAPKSKGKKAEAAQTEQASTGTGASTPR